jgi:hypothetical protein
MRIAVGSMLAVCIGHHVGVGALVGICNNIRIVDTVPFLGDRRARARVEVQRHDSLGLAT